MTVVCLEGEHDISTVPLLNATLIQAMGADDTDLVVDLSAVTFLGAATIDELVRGRDLLRLQSRTLLLRSPTTFARRILGVCGLTDLVEPDAAQVPATLSG